MPNQTLHDGPFISCGHKLFVPDVTRFMGRSTLR